MVGEANERVQKAAGVGVLGAMEQGFDIAVFDGLPRIHDHHVIRHLGHHAEVVGDENHGALELGPERGEKVQDLSLNGHIERRGGLVRDQQVRMAGDRGSDHDALAHAARKLVRVVDVTAIGLRNTHMSQQLYGPLLRFDLTYVQVLQHGLGNLVADAKRRIERVHWVLKDHADVVAADFAHLFL